MPRKAKPHTSHHPNKKKPLRLLNAVRQRSMHLNTKADEAQLARAEAVADRHGASLMERHPWIVGVDADYSGEHRQFVIVILINRPAKRLRGIPEKIAGIPIALRYTGTIAANE